VPEPLEIGIVRDVIPYTIVEARMEDDVNKIGYIALRQFNEKADQQFEEALTDLENQGVRGIILDLRGNPGGLLDVAVDIGSRFVPSGDILIIQNKGGYRSAVPSQRSKHNHTMYPLVVLVDQGSASASEIVAGAIKDHDAGTLVGTETFGKGLIQTIINLSDRSAVSITTAKYLTPEGHDVAKEKVKPDVLVEPSDDDLKSENDVQLKRAVQILKERLGANQAHAGDHGHEKS
jgi:carboxyl-terminal processing protease